MKILAVDDEPLILRLLETTLKGLGYSENTFAESGAEALKCLNAAPEPFDCILLDIRMPNLSGIDLLKQIRQLPSYRSTPVIMLTALSEKSYIDESFANGATDYLTKPLDATELLARLRVARLLCEANTNQQPSVGALPAREGEKFDFSDAIQIEDVPRVVNSLAMENYLLQLGRLGMFKLGTIGFQIRNANGLYAHEGCDEFREILTDVADCIFEATRAVNPVISYLGSGCFIAIVPRSPNFSSEDLEDLITTHLVNYRTEEGFDAEDEVRVLVGEQINGSLFGSSPLKIIDQALESVQKRHAFVPSRVSTRLMAI
ncbi:MULTISPECIES: response regulator [Shimia]|uniref:response regulator n=1 Tax=Shimia TaxID=573139 RepID=UPI001FB4E835|nr:MULTISPECIES: response regulator [Shimia]MDV4143582.1 response regulator [Shimia sp. FJ5]